MLATADGGDDPAAPAGEARVIVVTSGKGGVGKTTSTANIGSASPPDV
jgi:Mrp family chromosome partitioning ATPase